MELKYINNKFDFLFDMHQRKEIILFYEISGHVDKLSISIRKTDDWRINLIDDYNICIDLIDEIELLECVEKIKKSLNNYFDNIEKEEQKRNELLELKEREEFERLKKKFLFTNH